MGKWEWTAAVGCLLVALGAAGIYWPLGPAVLGAGCLLTAAIGAKADARALRRPEPATRKPEPVEREDA